jgi:hypothetical protein
MTTEKLQLCSFSICHYLPSISINLKEKQQPFDASYIGLHNKLYFMGQ